MIYLHQDEHNAIIINPNGHSGLTIQLVSYISRKLPNHSNELEEYNSNFVELSFTINVRDKAGNLNNQFKNELKDCISKCQHKLVIIQQNREYIEGALKDYVSATI